MDRVFLVQENYIKDRCDPDGSIIYHLLQQYARQNCDEVLPHEDFSCPSTTVRNAAKQNKKVIPVGDLDFVKSGINQTYGLHVPMRPIEVPESLRKYCHREYRICKGKDIPRSILYHPEMENWFIKDADVLKGFTNALCIGSCDSHIVPERHYVISERINILSEWRTFVWKDGIRAVQHYAGMPDIFPKTQELREMVKSYSEKRPDAYTLDVALIKKDSILQTAILEVHPFVSCGLYGFYDPKIPDMLEAGIDWYVNNP